MRVLVVFVIILLSVPRADNEKRGSGEVGGLQLAVEVAAASPASTPLWGFADLHAHQFANLGLGGLILWGAPFSSDDNIATALPYSDFLPAGLGTVQGIFGAPVIPLPLPSWRPGCPTPPFPCFGVNVHGPFGTLDTLNMFLTGRLQHNVGGGLDVPAFWDLLGRRVDPSPELPFDGWPAYDVLTAQQMYYEWLERAYRGGQRLMVMLAVNNQTLCQAAFHLAAFGCEDMPAIERQVQAAKDLEAFIDAKAGGPGQGWYRIVYSGAQARTVISQGKLAVVLGIEAPSLFGCKKDGDCTAQQVRDGVQHLYDLGVRHIFPVHNADNAFGGTALYNGVFDFSNAVITGKFWDLTSCPADVSMEFRVGWRDSAHDLGVAAAIASVAAVGPFNAAAILATSQLALPPRGPAGPHCNPRGLTPLGEVLVGELMKHDMIIDIDHTSIPTGNRILDIAEAANYPGIVAGHTGIIGVSRGENRHEGQKTDVQLGRIRNLGGLVGVILHQGGHDRIAQYDRGDRTVPFVCANASDAWLQAYLYVADRMGGGAVALGSDFNGFAGVPAPRTDPAVCSPGSNIGELPVVSYPFEGFGTAGQVFGRQQIGQRVVDYNYQGMASVGQLPDFIEEIRQLLPHDDDLNPLFNSAEAYVRMWEKAANNPPVARSQDVTVVADAVCVATASIDNGSSDPDGDPVIVTQSPPGPYGLGTTLVTLTVTDSFGASSTSQAQVTVVDITPPDISCPVDQVAPATSSAGAVVNAPAPVVTDNCQGAAVVCSPPSGSTFAIGINTVACAVTDAGGNQASCSFTVRVKGAAEQTNDLLTLVTTYGLPEGTANSLLAKLQAAISAMSRQDNTSACSMLRAFINEVRAQSGKALTVNQATQLITDANRIRSVLGCW